MGYEEQQNAIDNLRSGNYQLSTLMKDMAYNLAVKTNESIKDIENVNDLLTAGKVIETIGKVVGLTPKETQTNIQINAVNGFEFIELEQADILQIEMEMSDED